MPSDFPWLASNTWGLTRLTFQNAGGTQHSQIEFTYGSEGSGEPLNPMNDATQFADNFIIDMLPFLDVSVSLLQADTYLNVGGVIEHATFFPAANAGGRTGSGPLPPNVSVIMKKSSARIGRHGHGRVYLPGINRSDVDSSNPGQLSLTAYTNLTNAAATYYGHLQGAELQQALISRHPWGSPTPSFQFIGVTGFTIERTFATQRRRQRRAAHR